MLEDLKLSFAEKEDSSSRQKTTAAGIACSPQL